MMDYLDKRPFSNYLGLGSSLEGNKLWVDAGYNCIVWLEDHEAREMSLEEMCFAVGFNLECEISNGGVMQWLFGNMNRPDIATHAVECLHWLGCHGMAGHIGRTLDACLGQADSWKNLSAQEWSDFIFRRALELEAANKHQKKLIARTSIDAMGMTLDEWDAFYFDSERELAETGACPAYQEWFDKHAAVAAAAGDGQAYAQWVYVSLGKLGKTCCCESFESPCHAGDVGYAYWENELLAKGYEFALRHADAIRTELRPSD